MRGKGEGSIYRRADGYWVGQVEAGRTPSGRRRYARVVRKRRADVVAALAQLRRNADEGVVVDRTRNLGTFLDWWLANVAAGQVGASSLDEYRKRVERIKRHIGGVKLGRVATTDVQSLAAALAGEYSPRTARKTVETLRHALRWAVGAQIINRNPAEYVTPTRSGPAATIDDTMTADEAAAVLAAAVGDELEALWWLALKYGLRIGELLALRWPDVDLVTKELHVRKSKTAAGVRTLPLTCEAMGQLQRHRARLEVVELAGLVFPSPSARGGAGWDSQTIRNRWTDLLRRAGVEHRCRSCGTEARCSTSVRRFHVTRHTAATLQLEGGVPLEVVSAILGHASIGITAGTYAKVTADLKRRALESM